MLQAVPTAVEPFDNGDGFWGQEERNVEKTMPHVSAVLAFLVKLTTTLHKVVPAVAPEVSVTKFVPSSTISTLKQIESHHQIKIKISAYLLRP